MIGYQIGNPMLLTGSDMIYMAGIYRIEGQRASCTILTRTPADCIAHIHDRMPVILPREAVSDWLNLQYDPREVLTAALGEMTFQPCN